jgi:hypothetical protein
MVCHELHACQPAELLTIIQISIVLKVPVRCLVVFVECANAEPDSIYSVPELAARERDGVRAVLRAVEIPDHNRVAWEEAIPAIVVSTSQGLKNCPVAARDANVARALKNSEYGHQLRGKGTYTSVKGENWVLEHCARVDGRAGRAKLHVALAVDGLPLRLPREDRDPDEQSRWNWMLFDATEIAYQSIEPVNLFRSTPPIATLDLTPLGAESSSFGHSW